jgi:hypothetical protein
MMRLLPWRADHCAKSDAHLDESTFGVLLSGDVVGGAKSAVAHLASCLACRLRLQSLDPLLRIFPDDTVRVAVPPIPLPQRRRTALFLRYRLSFAALASAATVAATGVLALGVQPHPAALARNHIVQLTAMVRTAATHHDAVALHSALVEVSREMHNINSGPVDPSLLNDLASLRQLVASLPASDAAQSLAAIDEATRHENGVPPIDGFTPAAGPSDQPSPSVEPTPTPTAGPTPDTTPPPDTPAASPTDVQPVSTPGASAPDSAGAPAVWSAL